MRELRGAGGDDDMCDYLAAEVDAVDREADEAPAAPVAASPIKRDPAQMVDDNVVSDYRQRIVDLVREARHDIRVKGPTMRAVQKALMNEISEYYRLGDSSIAPSSSMQYGMPLPARFVPNEVTGRKRTVTELGPGERHDPQEYVSRWGASAAGADSERGRGGGE